MASSFCMLVHFMFGPGWDGCVGDGVCEGGFEDAVMNTPSAAGSKAPCTSRFIIM